MAFCEYEILRVYQYNFWIFSLFFLIICSNLFVLQMLLLFIGKKLVYMSRLGLQDSMLWFGWIAKIKLCQVLHNPKMKYQSCWFRGGCFPWFMVEQNQKQTKYGLKINFVQKTCFSKITMMPLCHKWKDLLDNGLNTWVIAQELV